MKFFFNHLGVFAAIFIFGVVLIELLLDDSRDKIKTNSENNDV